MLQTTSWVCSGLSIIILLIRTIVSHSTPHVTKLSQLLCVCSIVVITVRIPIVHYVLQYGTASDLVDTSSKHSQVVTEQLKTGSILVLFARTLATTYFWLQVALLLRFYMRVLGHIHWISKAIKVAWISIFATYTLCLLITFLECRPFPLYWRIEPKPDRCTLAYAQIFAQGICNIALDCILLVIAFPLLTYTRASVRMNIQVTVLVALGALCIIVTGLKLATVVGSGSQQKARTLWASIQILVSTFVANAPTIYGCIRLKIQRRNSGHPDADNGLNLTRTPSCPYDRFDEAFDKLNAKVQQQKHPTEPITVHQEYAG